MPIAVLSSARGEQWAIGPRSRFKLPIICVEAFSLLNVSRQADIVIYDAENQASFFRKVYPVEIVYAVIEVKTSMS